VAGARVDDDVAGAIGQAVGVDQGTGHCVEGAEAAAAVRRVGRADEDASRLLVDGHARDARPNGYCAYEGVGVGWPSDGQPRRA